MGTRGGGGEMSPEYSYARNVMRRRRGKDLAPSLGWRWHKAEARRPPHILLFYSYSNKRTEKSKGLLHPSPFSLKTQMKYEWDRRRRRPREGGKKYFWQFRVSFIIVILGSLIRMIISIIWYHENIWILVKEGVNLMTTRLVARHIFFLRLGIIGSGVD